MSPLQNVRLVVGNRAPLYVRQMTAILVENEIISEVNYSRAHSRLSFERTKMNHMIVDYSQSRQLTPYKTTQAALRQDFQEYYCRNRIRGYLSMVARHEENDPEVSHTSET